LVTKPSMQTGSNGIGWMGFATIACQPQPTWTLL
jgi:hypothetical protein